MNIKLEHELGRRARDFLIAMQSTIESSRTLPTARAANAGLVPAWRGWVDVLRRRDGSVARDLILRADSDYGPPRAGQAAVDLFVEAIRLNNPTRHERLQQWEVNKVATLGSAAALFLARPNAVIEPTAALQRWLVHTDIGEDVPASLFKLPLPAVFLRFGPEMAAAVDASLWASVGTPISTVGVYLFDTYIGNRRDLVFVPIGVGAAAQCDMPLIVQVSFENERDSLRTHVRNTIKMGPRSAGDLMPMVEMCAKVLLYMQSAGAVRVEEMRGDDALARLTRVGNRKASRIERQLAARYNKIIVGPAAIQHILAGEVSPHWRRGHMRMQPHGPQRSLRKLIFVAPALVRGDRLAAVDIDDEETLQSERLHRRKCSNDTSGT